MRVVVTGSSTGIGKSIVDKFLNAGHEVIGIDVLSAPDINKDLSDKYTHVIADVSKPDTLPNISDVEILINNAGVQNQGIRDIEVNLMGTYHCTEIYAIQPKIKSVLNVVSASAHSGAEFPTYTLSKGGILPYTKNVAQRIAKYGATCNSISPGGVITNMNSHIITDEKLWKAVLDETMLHKWATSDEIADWAYFLCVINKSMTAGDILIDNGEYYKSNFIW